MRRAAIVSALVFLATLVPTASSATQDQPAYTVEVTAEVKHDTSGPLREEKEEAKREKSFDHALKSTGGAPTPSVPDGALQTDAGPLVVTQPGGLNFAGVGNGDYGFAPDAAPPDTTGAAGSTQYVQWVNESYAVFDKATGALVLGPVGGSALWNGFGGGCETNNDGDPIVQYDKVANRWVLTQFSVTTTPYLQCVAVSTTSDATGSYNRYAFAYTDFNDYPKLGVWPDGYYITFNMFRRGKTYSGPRVCAYDRNAMLNGAAATQQCFQLATSQASLLPSDLDGSIAPPAGSPNFLVSRATNALNLWKFHVDWANTANTTLTGPTSIPVATFTQACPVNASCIAQSGTSNKLDSLGDRLMHRLAYRTFADGHEALLINHSVEVNATSHQTGIRWYELRNPSGGTVAGATPVVYQQGTYAPDASFRWMGSAAMDKVGNMAVGYSTSSSSMFPAIRFTGRAPSDPAGTLQAESSIIAGGGSQTGTLHRWGDYSSMSIDPVDDCTFWYTTEYLKASGTFNWSTRIASFKLTGCQ